MVYKIKLLHRIISLIVVLLLIHVPFSYQDSKAIAATSAMEQRFSGWGPGYLGLAVTPDGKTAYIPFSQDDVILIVDLLSFTVTGSIDVSAAGNQLDSGAILITPDGKKLYVSNYAAGNVMVVNTLKRSVECVLPLQPAGAVASSISPDGSKVYIPSADGGLFIIKVADDTYQRVFVPGVIFGPVSPSLNNPNILYTPGILVQSVFQPTFFEFDVESKAVKRNLRLPEDSSQYPVTSARRLVISSDESKAYFGRYIQGGADKGIGSFYTIDLKNFRILASQPIDRGVADFAAHESNNKIYIAGCWGGGSSSLQQSIQEWDISADMVVRNIPVSPSSDQRSIAIDPTNANNLYMTEGDFNLLRKIEISTGKEIARVQFNKDEARPYAVIPDGNTGYIISYSQDINKLDMQSGQLTGSIHVPVSFNGFGFYKGRIYVESGDRIRAIDPANGAIVKEYPVGSNINTLFFTFYGNKMVTIDFEQGGMVAKQLLVFDADKMSLLKTVKLPSMPYGHKILVSPDGSKLYLVGGPMWGAPTVITILDSTTFDTLNTISIPPVDIRRGATGFLEGDFDENKRVLYILGFTSVYMVHMDSDKLIDTLDLIDVNEARGSYGWPPTGLAGIMLSRSGDKLFLVSGDAHSMYTYDLKNSSWTTKITNVKGYFITNAVASPDRRYLFTVNNRSDSITMIDTDVGAVARIIYLNAGGTKENNTEGQEITFQVGNPKMIFQGAQIEIDGNGTKPVLVNGRTLLPIRALIEAMGGQINWNGTEGKVSIELKSNKIELWINKKEAIVNGQQKELDVSAQIINARTMTPLRFVTENLGCNTSWDGETQTIIIKY